MHIINTTNTLIPSNLNNKFPSLINLRIEFTDLSEITQQHTQPLTNIVNLYLGNNNIRHISHDAFYNTTEIKLLYLNGNKISKLHNEAFHNLVQLERIFLENNYLTELDEKIFSNNKNLKRIYLQNNKLLIIDPGTFNLPNLSVLNVRDNVCISKWSFDTNMIAVKAAIENFCNPSVEKLRTRTIDLMKIVKQLTVRDHVLREELATKNMAVQKLKKELEKFKSVKTTHSEKSIIHEIDES